VYPNGERYAGAWLHGRRHGVGTYSYVDGGRCVDPCVLRARCLAARAGAARSPRLPPGCTRVRRYEGEWVDDRIQGKGKSFYANGNVYDGACATRRGGVARYCSSRAAPLFVRACVRVLCACVSPLYLRLAGEWQDGRINGFGTLTYADGDKYVGLWVDGKMNGQGTYIYADGDKYDGEWKDDRRHGKGTVIYRGADGAVVEKFEGDWFEGKMHGHGRYVYADSGVYQGQWVDSKMYGKGTYVFPNGNKYEGEWVDDVKDGYGVLTYVNGERFEGYWKADKAQGKGTLTYSTGDRYIGAPEECARAERLAQPRRGECGQWLRHRRRSTTSLVFSFFFSFPPARRRLGGGQEARRRRAAVRQR
jgi:hypothetical protein